MEELLSKSTRLVKRLKLKEPRYLYDKISWNNRLIGIKGARGTGKSTLLLQRIKKLNLPPEKATYWSLDDFFFINNNLVETARQFYNQGGKFLFLDEVHKYDYWARQIKNLYDEFDDLKIVFTGSSIIDISRQEVDLSRRALIYNLHGFSFREYLKFRFDLQLPVLSLSEILTNKSQWQDKFPADFRPLQYFNQYLKLGYYPFSLEDEENFASRLQQVVRIIIEYDMAGLKEFDLRNAQKLLQLLYLISVNVPFKPNISELARKTGIHRNTINTYLHFLEQAELIRLLNPAGISMVTLQKPEKILLNNTALAFAISEENPNQGSLRESFIASQLSVHHKIELPKKGDFLIDDQWTFEVGGKGKTKQQIQNIKNSFVIADDLDFPIHKLPLWIFGMLY